ncbi:MAG: hypothetical protein AAF236_03190, partial [Verrucomicrobiota bacterium]
FIKAFGEQYQGGGHGLEVRKDASGEFLYITGYHHLKLFAKLTLDGEVVWTKYAPMESGLYAEKEDTVREKVWGRDRFLPTNFAFLDDGGFLLADGYGAWTIHRYDADGNWQGHFGEIGKEEGQFRLPHGIWIDNRGEGEPEIVIADRSNGRVQWFSMSGEHLRTDNEHILPANMDVYGDLLLIPDLSARITLLDGKNQPIYLGEDPAWREVVLADNKVMRKRPDDWVSGKFIHPHDACFDAEGNILVAEWVDTGRVSKLRKVG